MLDPWQMRVGWQAHVDLELLSSSPRRSACLPEELPALANRLITTGTTRAGGPLED